MEAALEAFHAKHPQGGSEVLRVEQGRPSYVKPLPSSTGATSAALSRASRPGCVTAYAILLWIGAPAVVVIGIVMALASRDLFGLVVLIGFYFLERALNIDSWNLFETVLIGIYFWMAAALNVVAGIGLWKMKNWGRILIIVLHSLGIAASVLLSGCATLFVAKNVAVPAVCGLLVGIGVSIYMISWFVNHRYDFS